jgi:hypothetical protein
MKNTRTAALVAAFVMLSYAQTTSSAKDISGIIPAGHNAVVLLPGYPSIYHLNHEDDLQRLPSGRTPFIISFPVTVTDSSSVRQDSNSAVAPKVPRLRTIIYQDSHAVPIAIGKWKTVADGESNTVSSPLITEFHWR